ncbi:MAG: hypothetical protein SFW67_17675 [Myxococcaceae bacterium]|nr:hypothetical protein [Myxococcaceae bacterium]
MTSLMLVAALAQWEPPVDTVSDFEVVGCTKDGTRLLYFGPNGVFDGRVVYFAILDLRTAHREVLDVISEQTTRKTWRKAFTTAKKLKAKKLEWVDCHASRTSPDGQFVAELVPQAGVTSGTWALRAEPEWMGGNQKKPTRETWTPNGTLDWQLARKAGEAVTPLTTSDSSDRITTFWTPGGERLIWRLHLDSRAMRDPGRDWFLVTAGDGPTVEVVSAQPPSAKDEALLGALDSKESRVVNWRQSPKAIEKSVVEFAPGFEAQAHVLAEKVPGAEVQAAENPGLVPLRVLLASRPGERKKR